MIPGIGLAPFFEHSHQTLFGYIRLHDIFWQISQSKSRKCGAQHLRCTVENDLPFHADSDFTARSFKFPRVETAVSGQPQIDAAVVDQILRRLGFRSLFELRRRADDRHADVRADAYGNHVLGNLFPGPHTGVESLGDDVG